MLMGACCFSPARRTRDSACLKFSPAFFKRQRSGARVVNDCPGDSQSPSVTEPQREVRSRAKSPCRLRRGEIPLYALFAKLFLAFLPPRKSVVQVCRNATLSAAPSSPSHAGLFEAYTYKKAGEQPLPLFVGYNPPLSRQIVHHLVQTGDICVPFVADSLHFGNLLLRELVEVAGL